MEGLPIWDGLSQLRASPRNQEFKFSFPYYITIKLSKINKSFNFISSFFFILVRVARAWYVLAVEKKYCNN